MITEPLKIKILKHLSDQTCVEDWDFIYPGIVSTDCTVYRISSPHYSKDMALKLYHQNKISKKAHQYSALERFSATLNKNNARYLTPEPYGFFADKNFFLMEWATGDDLETLLWKNCLHKGRLQIYIKEAFHWLKHFHKHSNLNFKQVDITSYPLMIESHCERLNLQNFCENNPIFADGFNALNKFTEQFVEYETLHADIHGDINLSNLILDDKYVMGIDIGATENAPIVNDMTLLLHYICVDYFNMLTRFDMRKPISTWEIFNVALDAYEYPKEEKARHFFLFVFLYQMLRRWITGVYFHKTPATPAKQIKKSVKIVMLEKWRLHNFSVIVKGLTEVIDERL